MHTYADRDQFWSALADAGADEHRAQDELVRIYLEGVSRKIDEFCRRTRGDLPGLGFGPIKATHYYEAVEVLEGADGLAAVDLAADLLSATEVAAAATTGGTYTTWSAGTDYVLRPYGFAPYRQLVVPDTSGVALPAAGLQALRIVGTWGYSDTRRTLAGKVATGGWTDTATALLMDDASEVAAGMTLWCQSEAIYVRGTSGGTLTVVRGAHGTTAAAHTAATAVQAQEYDPSVVTCALQLVVRRWKQRDIGLSGEYGGFGGPTTQRDRAAEIDILRANVGWLAYEGRG